VFDIGKELSPQAWRSVIRQLVVRGYLRVDPERYGALVLTDSSRSLLRGETELGLREDPKAARSPKKPKVRAAVEAMSENDRALFDELRELRRQIATEHGVPPYVIFHDSTLMQMAVERPVSADEMLALSGVGKKKLEKHGEAFLELLTRA